MPDHVPMEEMTVTQQNELAEAQFLERAKSIMMDQGIQEEEHGDLQAEQDIDDNRKAEDPQEHEAEEEEEEIGKAAQGEEEEEEQEDLPKVSVRIDGKKAAPEDLLSHLTFTPKIDGEEVEVSYDELLSGYQRGADYSRKTTEMKRQNDEIQPYLKLVAHAKNDPKFVDYVTNYFEKGPYPELMSNPNLAVDDAKLSAMMDRSSDSYDPDQASEVIKARAEWQKVSHERQQTAEKVQQDMMTRYSEWANDQVAAAQEAIDAIGGEGEYVRKSDNVLDFLRKTGFNDDEIAGRTPLSSTDARAAVLAYKASEYDRMMREAEAPKVRLGKKRKRMAPPRSQSAGTGTRNASGSKKQRDSYRKAVNSQKDDDWLNVIKGRMQT